MGILFIFLLTVESVFDFCLLKAIFINSIPTIAKMTVKRRQRTIGTDVSVKQIKMPPIEANKK